MILEKTPLQSMEENVRNRIKVLQNQIKWNKMENTTKGGELSSSSYKGRGDLNDQ